jgi:hypothetical protein
MFPSHRVRQATALLALLVCALTVFPPPGAAADADGQFGHAVGLAHSAKPGSLMSAIAPRVHANSCNATRFLAMNSQS